LHARCRARQESFPPLHEQKKRAFLSGTDFVLVFINELLSGLSRPGHNSFHIHVFFQEIGEAIQFLAVPARRRHGAQGRNSLTSAKPLD
jgi:hypothetical protein